MSRRLQWCWWGLLGFALLSRLLGLGDRVMSHDESIHVFTAWNTLQHGPYVHDPVYHGPLLYFLNRVVFEWGGAGDFAGRLAPALAGILLVLAPFLFRRELGERGALVSSVLLLVSPSVVFYSRYNRHDVLAALLALLLFRLLWSVQARRGVYLLGIAGCFAGLLLTKEVSYIYGALFGAGLGLVGLLQWRWGSAVSLFHAWRGSLVLTLLVLGLLVPFAVDAFGGDPLDFSRGGLKYIMPLFIVCMVFGGGVGLLMFGRRWLGAFGLFYGLLLLGYTWFGQHPMGAYTGLFGSLGYWLSQHDVARGSQPGYFYGLLTLLYEGPLLLLLLYGLFIWGRRWRAVFPGMLLFWLLGSVVIYSWAGEKMPWLMMHLVLPASLFVGWALAQISFKKATLLLGCAVLPLLGLSFRVNVAHANAPNELMQYAAGHEDVKTLLNWLEALDRAYERPMVVGCGTDLAWPFNWYFRDRTNFYWEFSDLSGTADFSRYDVLLVGLDGWEAGGHRVLEAWGGPLDVKEVRLGLTHWPDQGYRKPFAEHVGDVREGGGSLKGGLALLLHGQAYDPALEWPTQTTFLLIVRRGLVENSKVAWPF